MGIQKRRLDNDFSFVMRHGINIYPVFKRGQWFVQVNNNGVIITSNTPMYSGSTLQGASFVKPMEKAFKYFADKLLEVDVGEK